MTGVELAMCREDARSEHERMGDAELWTRSNKGDEAAAEELFRRYYPLLIGLARKRMGRFLREMEESSDLAQSVLVSVLKAPQIDFSRNDSLWPLLMKTLLNKICSHDKYFKRKRRDRRREVPLEDRDLAEADLPPEYDAMLEDVIQGLKEPFGPQRQEIIDSLIKGLSIPEIASRAGISKRTVYRTGQHIRQILSKMLVAS